MKRNLLSVTLLAGLLSTGPMFASGVEGQKPATPNSKAAGDHKHRPGQEHDHREVIGIAGKAAKVNRTVTIDMTDNMRFNPSSVSVQQGETIRFVVKNSGQLKHEFVLGTAKELKAHYEVMKKFPEMEHDDPNMVTVAPGKSGDVIWQFTKSGRVDFACLQLNHFEAGMKGAVSVATVKAVAKNGGQAPRTQ